MRTWMRTMAIVVFTTLIGTPSLAFDLGGADNITKTIYFGSSEASPTNCTVNAKIGNHNGGRAFIYLAGIQLRYAGRTHWSSGQSIIGSYVGIEKWIIEHCFNITDSSLVTNFTQKGADADSFEEQQYMGFAFTLLVDTYTHAAGHHEIYIGTAPNSAPTANAGTDQTSVASTATVTLDGSSSADTDIGDTLTYAWSQTSGTTVTLSSATAENPTFTAPTLNIGDADTTLVFSLTTNDGTVNSTADTVSIKVIAPLDTTAPTLSSVGIASSNSTTTQAVPDDIVTLTLTASETISTPTVTFKSGGASITDTTVTYTNTSGNTWTAKYTANASDTSGAVTYSIAFSDTVGNSGTAVTSGTGSVAVDTTTASPATEFEAKKDAIRSIITKDAQRSLNNTLASNTRLTRGSRKRFLTGLANCKNTVLDADGKAVATPEQLSTQGTFFAQTNNLEGTQCRLVFSDFDVQRDGNTGSFTATLNGKVAWEQMSSEQTMLGYYLGGEVTRSDIQDSFTGTKDTYGLNVGSYFVHTLRDNLFLDGFTSLGAGHNNLEMSDGTLALTSDYTTQTVTLGSAFSGVYEYGQYDFHPELAFNYGKTWFGSVGFTGVAHGLTDDTLSLDAGEVSIANLTLRPEIVWALDAETVADSNTQISFAPRFICQRTSATSTTQDCGAGAETGLSNASEDGLSSAHIRLVIDRVGNINRSSFALNFERSF